ncbi:MAG: S1/P1 nuclease, partial [Acidobacteriota bacterium]
MYSKRTLCSFLAVSLALLMPPPLSAWNDTGHKLVAAIAWDHMTPGARQRAIALLQAAPPDACLLDRFPTDSRPLAVREREFFVIAGTWADLVRPDRAHPRPCERFHRASWHFINYFYSLSIQNSPAA